MVNLWLWLKKHLPLSRQEFHIKMANNNFEYQQQGITILDKLEEYHNNFEKEQLTLQNTVNQIEKQETIIIKELAALKKSQTNLEEELACLDAKDDIFDRLNKVHNDIIRSERIISYYKTQRDLMYWLIYVRPNESILDAKKRFFLSIPPASGSLRELQLLDKCLLKEFDSICKLHNLSYWLWGGTLLGAIRHRGFIPWDDDIDIGMPRMDFHRLNEVLQSNTDFEIKIKFDSCVYCKQVRFQFKNDNIPAFIDIFLYDYCPQISSLLNTKKNSIKTELITNLSTSSDPAVTEFRQNLLIDADSANGKIINDIFDYYQQELVNTGVVSETHNGIGIFYGIDNYDPNISNISYIEEYFPLQQYEFEGGLYFVPNQYMSILEKLYGTDIYSLPNGEPHFEHVSIEENKNSIHNAFKKIIQNKGD